MKAVKDTHSRISAARSMRRKLLRLGGFIDKPSDWGSGGRIVVDGGLRRIIPLFEGDSITWCKIYWTC